MQMTRVAGRIVRIRKKGLVSFQYSCREWSSVSCNIWFETNDRIGLRRKRIPTQMYKYP